MAQDRLILVVGGTGTQGGNVARELLKHGHRVRILTRNAESQAARLLAAQGAEIIQGDMAYLASLEPAMDNVSAIFSAQYADPTDRSIEHRNTANMVQAARKAGVEQVVHTSVVGTDVNKRWNKYQFLAEMWEAKYEVEQLVRKGGFRYWTVQHPTWFMENFIEPGSAMMAPDLKRGVLFGNLYADTPIKLNSGEETAKFARAAFENPERFSGKDINIASDELSMSQIAETLSRILGKQVVYESLSREAAVQRGLLPGTAYSMEWMNEVPGFGFDIEETRQYGVPLKSFAEWVEENKQRIDIR